MENRGYIFHFENIERNDLKLGILLQFMGLNIKDKFQVISCFAEMRNETRMTATLH